MTEVHNIIFFDGVCNFCNSTVDFFFSKNKKKNIFYSSLQSPFAQSVLPDEYLEKEDYNTIYYYLDGVFYSKSTAVLKATKELKGGYKLLSTFLIVPTFIRNFVYDFISKRRYEIFGKRDTCRLPAEEEKRYFLEEKLDESKYILHKD